MGNGEKSEVEVYRLEKRLREAFSMHSGLQQGQGHIDDFELAGGKLQIRDTILDIATALGVEVEIK
jgi:hypothetical protein